MMKRYKIKIDGFSSIYPSADEASKRLQNHILDRLMTGDHRIIGFADANDNSHWMYVGTIWPGGKIQIAREKRPGNLM